MVGFLIRPFLRNVIDDFLSWIVEEQRSHAGDSRRAGPYFFHKAMPPAGVQVVQDPIAEQTPDQSVTGKSGRLGLA